METEQSDLTEYIDIVVLIKLTDGYAKEEDDDN